MDQLQLVLGLYAISAIVAGITVVSIIWMLSKRNGSNNEVQQQTKIDIGNTQIRSPDRDSQRTGSKRDSLSMRANFDDDDVQAG